MAKTKAVKELDHSTEEKIKLAARKLFTQKGYAATRTRDIAEESGINLALLNYYFRSKEKLFELIMKESMQQFIHGVAALFSDVNTPLDAKLEKLVSGYIDLLTENPDLPIFVLSELRSNPEKFSQNMLGESDQARATFVNQLQQIMKKGGMGELHVLHFIANMIGLTVFPFVGRPMLQKVGNVSHEQFNELMQERKKLIPMWLKAMMMAK